MASSTAAGRTAQVQPPVCCSKYERKEASSRRAGWPGTSRKVSGLLSLDEKESVAHLRREHPPCIQTIA